MKKTILFSFLIFLQLVAFASSSGTCGKNLTWIFDETSGTLSISGTGKMEGYSQGSVPWYDYREDIKVLDIGDGVTSIGAHAFASFNNLESVIIPDGITTIENGAFVFCERLSSVIIGSGVTSIGNQAFNSCNSLVSIDIPDGVVTIGQNAFSNCSNLTTVVIGNGLTQIEKNTFRSCGSLKEVSIGNNVSIIGEGAFYECVNLSSVTIPNSVTIIYGNAFYKCHSITKLELGEHVEYISDYAFANCNSLASVVLPPSVTSIGWYAFSGCHSLTSIVIPNSVSYIAEGAFAECSGLTAISVEEGNSKYDSRDNCNAIIETLSNRIIVGCQTTKIPNSVSTIGILSFCGSKMTSLDIPNSVTCIESEAFLRCTMLSSINIPNSVISLGGCAFYGCSNLSFISIPDNIQTIAGKSFEACYSLKIVELGSRITKIESDAFKDCKSLAVFTCKTETPPEAYFDYYLSNSFRNVSLSQVNLFVPASSVELYKTSFPWMYFGKIRSIGKYYIATLTSKGNGQINYGSNVIRNTTERYELESKEGMKLTFIPDEGYSLESVTVNGIEIGNDLSYSLNSLEEDIDIIASFVINSYKLTYMVDNEIYKTYDVEYGTAITSEPEPTKEGCTFSGWNNIPETMPANDVTVTGSFTVNKYKVTYIIDGEVFATDFVEYGATIVPPTVNEKEGFTFDGWTGIPDTMPANDITITGSFTVNKYKVTYIIDDEVFATDYVEYGATIVPPTVGEKEGFTFDGWSDIPETMPAHDITIYGSYTSGIAEIKMDSANVRIYNINGKRINKLQRGINIIIGKDGKVRKVNIK